MKKIIAATIAAIALTPSAAMAEWLDHPQIACTTDAVNVRSGLRINLNTTHPSETLRAYPPNQRPVVATLPQDSCYRVAENTGNNTYAGGYRWVLLHIGHGETGWVAADYLRASYLSAR